MKQDSFNIWAILGLSFLVAFFCYKYYQTKEEKKILESLLKRSAYSIDRDNSNIHKDLREILDYKFNSDSVHSEKRYFDSFITKINIVDSNELLNNFKDFIRKQIFLNDSLISFRKRVAIDAFEIKCYTTETLQHNDVYKFGDTVDLNLYIFPKSDLPKDHYRIINFTPKELGSNSGNLLRFLIPTNKLVKFNQVVQNYTFEYTVICKNDYTNTLDTLYMSKAFKIIP